MQLDNIPTTWTSGITSPFSIDVSLARLFFEAGSLLTPLANQDFIKWYAAIRYSHSIDDGTVELRVRDEFNRDSVDCRYRGLFAEEMAIGLMAVVSGDVFGARPINNTIEVMLPRTAVLTGGLIADFLAQAINPTNSERTTIIAESKGSLGKAISNTRQTRAKQQVAATNAIVSGTAKTLPLTFGSTVCFTSRTSQTRCLVTDPPKDFNEELINVNPIRAWRIAYAKTFRFIGMETAARQIYRGEPADSIHSFDFNVIRAR